MRPAATARGAALLAVAGVALGVVLPAPVTGAYLTATATAAAADAGTGSWCPLPDHETYPNVYTLRDDFEYFPSAFGDGLNLYMLIVPVLNVAGDDDFAPLVDAPTTPAPDGAKVLGVRLWGCSSVLDGKLKITAWRRDVTQSGVMVWRPPESPGWAGQRLSPHEGWGLDLQEMHRFGARDATYETRNGGVVKEARSQYTWLAAQPRTADTPDAFPTCGSSTCQLAYASQRFDYLFRPEDGTSASPRNDVTYLGGKYWTGEGVWPSTGPWVVEPTVLQTYLHDPTPPTAGGTDPTATDGRQVQWVVMEHRGTTRPDLRVEVFLR